MELSFQASVAEAYSSGTQRAKHLSEHWASQHCYCPICGNLNIVRQPDNAPVKDFVCPNCDENFELKSQRRKFGAKVVDGAYRTMIDRLKSNSNPNLLLLHYDHNKLIVRDLIFVPKFFFVPEMISARRPLPPSARRAGWIGCNILLNTIPDSGRIYMVRDCDVLPAKYVFEKLNRSQFLADSKNLDSKRWLLSVMKCIDSLQRQSFNIQDIYQFEDELHEIYPENNNIRAKIRQQLQFLRDKGYIDFLGNGSYKLLSDLLRSEV
jgi:type II restriction enzyme